MVLALPRRRCVTASVVALFALSGCSLAPAASPTPSPPPAGIDAAAVRLRAEAVASGFDAPILVTNAGDGRGRLFVIEQAGRIRIVRDGRSLAEPFLDIGDRISAGGERGLLGLAFHPDFPTDPRFFVDYTDSDGNTVVSSFLVAGGSGSSADRADPASETVLLTIAQPFANHNGGALVFGPDGYLYVATGDGGGAGDPQGNGQRLDTLLGKLLRLDVDTPSAGRRYGIPAGNPFASAGGAPEIWAYGLRNPWRFSFDRTTGDLWIADVGQNAREEVTRLSAGTPGGANLGWARMEGSLCFPSGAECVREGLVLPLAEYPTREGGCAITGGFVGRGPETTGLMGIYVFGDYCSGRIWGLDADGPDRQEPVLLLESGRSITSFGEDEAGGLYFTDSSRGELVRLVTGG